MQALYRSVEEGPPFPHDRSPDTFTHLLQPGTSPCPSMPLCPGLCLQCMCANMHAKTIHELNTVSGQSVSLWT